MENEGSFSQDIVAKLLAELDISPHDTIVNDVYQQACSCAAISNEFKEINEELEALPEEDTVARAALSSKAQEVTDTYNSVLTQTHNAIVQLLSKFLASKVCAIEDLNQRMMYVTKCNDSLKTIVTLIVVNASA